MKRRMPIYHQDDCGCGVDRQNEVNEPVHGPDCNHSHQEPVRNTLKGIGRNDPCPCGSQKKFKKCHGA